MMMHGLTNPKKEATSLRPEIPQIQIHAHDVFQFGSRCVLVLYRSTVLWAAQCSLHPHSEGEQSIFFPVPQPTKLMYGIWYMVHRMW